MSYIDGTGKEHNDMERALEPFKRKPSVESVCSADVEELAQLLLECDDVALTRGDQYGLCDSIDNHGCPYPSARLDEILTALREQYNKLTDPQDSV